MPAPSLPTWQDCHELWSKQRRRQQREQEQAQAQAKGKPYALDDKEPDLYKPAEPAHETLGQVK